MKLGMVDYIRDPTPHDNFSGGSSMWVPGHARDLSNLGVSFLSFFLSFFFLLSSPRAQVAFLDRSHSNFVGKCIDHMIPDLPQKFMVKGSKVKVIA